MAERQKSLEALFQDAEETIEGIVRKKFRVSLSPSDGRRENQNAFDLCQQVKLLLWEKLVSEDGEMIRDVRGYAAVLTYNQCSQRLRNENPEWTRLKHRLRYFFGTSRGFATWENDAGDLMCGFVSWQNRKTAPTAAGKLDALKHDAWAVLPSSLHNKDVWQLKRTDWEQLTEAVFDHAASPLELDDLVTIVGDAFGVKEVKEESTTVNEDEETKRRGDDLRSKEPTPEDKLALRQYLSKLWQEICQLRPGQRVAYMLNFRDAEGDIGIFPAHDIATLAEIGRALQIADEQFDRAWDALPLDEATRASYKTLASYDEKFMALCRYVPLEDLVIARLLGGERQQVINLRRLARDRLIRQMEAFR